MAWCSRVVLICLAAVFTFLALQSHSLIQPYLNHFLRSLGIPYKGLLWAELNFDYFTHILGAFLLTLLIYSSDIPWLRKSRNKVLLCGATVMSLAFVAEIGQWIIGRGFSLKDLATGAFGIFCAMYLLARLEPDRCGSAVPQRRHPPSLL